MDTSENVRENSLLPFKVYDCFVQQDINEDLAFKIATSSKCFAGLRKHGLTFDTTSNVERETMGGKQLEKDTEPKSSSVNLNVNRTVSQALCIHVSYTMSYVLLCFGTA